MPFSGIFPAAEVVPAPFGLASVATVVDHALDDSHWVSGYEQEFGLCDVVVKGWGVCASSASSTLHDSAAAARFGRMSPFGVVIEDACDSPLGPSLRKEREDRLLALLDLASLKAAEQELWTGAVTIDQNPVAADRNKYLMAGGTAVGGAAHGPAVALAILEDALASCGVGELGVIHMTRGTASLLGDALYRTDDGKRLTTRSGTLVVAGAGYPSLTATTSTMYATGPVVVHRGAAAMLSEQEADYFDAKSNKYVLRAEQPVAATWDGCCHYSAAVDYTV